MNMTQVTSGSPQIEAMVRSMAIEMITELVGFTAGSERRMNWAVLLGTKRTIVLREFPGEYSCAQYVRGENSNMIPMPKI